MLAYPWMTMLGALLLLAAFTTSTAQDRRPSGTVIVESRSVSVGVGVIWGDGRLTFRGGEYTFSLSGLSAVDLGVSRVGARGEVYDLRAVDDFSGMYVAAASGAAAGAGAGSVVMVNPAGVTIRLVGAGRGVRLVLGAEGVEIRLRQ